MWQDRQFRLLKQEIETLLAPLSDVVGLMDLAKEPLKEVKRGLSVKSVQGPPWVLLPLIVCESISGYYKRAVPAAVALQFLITAGDVFDDIEDADSPQSLPCRHGSAIAINIATTLLILAERAIARLTTTGVDDNTIVRVLDTINSYYTTACAGQHLDLSLISEESISEEKYLKIVSMKSASQIECACYIGALLAKANQKMVDIFAAFGRNLGMAAQIANDVLGISAGNDISKNKLTLPVVYALTQLNGEVHKQLKNMLYKPKYLLDPELVKDLLYRTGAIHYTLIKIEFYKQRALDYLSEAEKTGVSVNRLKPFLE